MRTTVELPDSLYQAIEVRAAQRGVPVAQTMQHLLQEGLAATEVEPELPRPVISTDPVTGFPVIDCDPAPPGQELTPDRIAEILLEQEVAWHLAAGQHEAGR